MEVAGSIDRINRVLKVKINKENPLFRIEHLRINKVNSGNANNILASLGDTRIVVHFKHFSSANSQSQRLFDGDLSNIRNFVNDPTIPVNFEFPSINLYDYVEFELVDITEVGEHSHYSIEIVIETKNISVPIVNPLQRFREHFEISTNVKIFFSAPFGQGKTTFLDLFFSIEENKVNLFRLFPVNYSVSSNEDIFKYIKANILVQLFEKPCSFDKETFSYAQTFPAFFASDPIKILSPFIKLLPKIGHSAYEIVKPLIEITNGYFDVHEKYQIDDEKIAVSFVKELYENEGSIFEDNFFTQLIRQQLEYLRNTTGKRNVLVIDDLDRIDPEHIFRILNVFSANFDHRDSTTLSNKFGFDKIIIVGDIKNIQHIYAYRYGPEVRFEGYINKYFSEHPFHYDNKKAFEFILQEIGKLNGKAILHEGLVLFLQILSDLVAVEEVTLRELYNLKRLNPNRFFRPNEIQELPRGKEYFHWLLPFCVFQIFSRLYDLDLLVKKFEKCQKVDQRLRIADYNSLANMVLPALVVKNSSEKGQGTFTLEQQKIRVNYKMEYNHSYNLDFYNSILSEEVSAPGAPAEITYDRRDFYKILVLATVRFKEVGGFE